MKLLLTELDASDIEHGQQLADFLKGAIEKRLAQLEDDFVQDLSHISQAAVFSGDMRVDGVEFLKDNLYRCDYSYGWQIAWTCSGTQESGRAKEKVRFTLSDDAEITFKFLNLQA